jgi:hypothetical protein
VYEQTDLAAAVVIRIALEPREELVDGACGGVGRIGIRSAARIIVFGIVLGGPFFQVVARFSPADLETMSPDRKRTDAVANSSYAGHGARPQCRRRPGVRDPVHERHD